MPYVARVGTALTGEIFGAYMGIAGMHNTFGDVQITMSELAFFAGAVRQDTGGATAISQVAADFGDITSLNDNDTSTTAAWSTAAEGANTHFFVGYNFGSPPTTLDGLKVAAGTNPALPPADMDVLQSVDGIYWVLVDEAIGISGTQPASGNTFGVLTPFALVTPPGAKRYWRITNWDTHNYPSATDRNLKLSEVRLYSGSTNKTGDATASTSMTFSSGALSDWLDGSTATMAEVAFANIGPVVFDFGSTVAIDGVRFGTADDSNKWPYQVDLEWSDDNSNWNPAGSVRVLSYPANNTLTSIIRLY